MSDCSKGNPADEAVLAEVRARVLAEAARFREKLPALLSVHRDKWVVFRDGEVVSVHDSGEEAYLAGQERFGPYGGHVISQVREADLELLGGLTVIRE